MNMRETTPDENSIKSVTPLENEQGDIHQWAQELGGEASLIRIERDGRKLIVITAEHFSEQAARFFQEDIEITNPAEWYFLVEGKDSEIHECAIAKRIAEEQKIPIDDPVFHPFCAEVIELYLASDKAGISREILMGQLAATLLYARGTWDLEPVATILGVESAEELYLNIIHAVAEKSKDPEVYSARSKQMFHDLIEISNLVSAQVLDYYLRKNPTRTHVALYLGKAHEGIVEMDLSQIPENLKFSDDQIKELLDRRERARVQQVHRDLGIKLTGEEAIPSALEPATQRVEPKAKPASSTQTSIANVMDEMSNIPKNLRTIIEKWSDNIFNSEYINFVKMNGGYENYLNSDSLHQIWGAAALLAEKVASAQLANRGLTEKERREIERAFLKVANSRREEGSHHRDEIAKLFETEGDELAELAENIHVLAEIMKSLKQ